ncbi:MAG: STAS-like domain-containing protein [Alphaproteobacteria bacterium]|nr:STAS-like domain-containing protein [Alphaproteobacteria bacterium]
MVITALDHVRDCYTWDSGAKIADLIRGAFARGEHITVSFAGVTDIPSSFANAAFISLLDTYSYDYVKSHLAVTNATRQIVDMIKRRFTFVTTQGMAA